MLMSVINLRPVERSDLDAINRVVEAAVMTWDLPERVKRLSLSSYRYTTFDLDHFAMVVAEDQDHNIVGVAAWEAADSREAPQGLSALLLHGIFVRPTHHHQGIGRQLFLAAEHAMHQQRFDGLLVKAQHSADGFFSSMGMLRLPTEDALRHYANRFWKDNNP